LKIITTKEFILEKSLQEELKVKTITFIMIDSPNFYCKFNLDKRVYLGPTTTDATLSFIMVFIIIYLT